MTIDNITNRSEVVVNVAGGFATGSLFVGDGHTLKLTEWGSDVGNGDNSDGGLEFDGVVDIEGSDEDPGILCSYITVNTNQATVVTFVSGGNEGNVSTGGS